MFQLYGILLVCTDTKKLEHIQQKFVALSPRPWQLQGSCYRVKVTHCVRQKAPPWFKILHKCLSTQVQNLVNFFHLLKTPEFLLTILGTSAWLPLPVKTVYLLPVLQLLTWCTEVLTETHYFFKTYSVLIWYYLNNTDLRFLSIQQSLSFIITFCVLM
jgi:hypothetical protein